MTELLAENYIETLKELAAEASEIKVLIAFLTEGGLDWLPRDKYTVSKFIAGLNLFITTPEALSALKCGGAEVRVFSDGLPLFHPKAIYFKNPQGESSIPSSARLEHGRNYRPRDLSALTRHWVIFTSDYDHVPR